MKIHFLGTNGWFDSETGETPSILIDSSEAYVIFDAGNSFRKIDRYILDTTKPIILFLSHFHIDHISGLHILAKFSFQQGITIVGQPGTKKILATLINHPFTVPFERLKRDKALDVRVIELSVGKTKFDKLEVVARALDHADPCFGYSILLENKKIVYCTDTGICDNFITLAKDADLLITECAWRIQNQSKGWPHLAPEDAAEVAKRSNAKKLIMTHFDANGYSLLAHRKDAENRAKKIFKNTLAAVDDYSLLL